MKKAIVAIAAAGAILLSNGAVAQTQAPEFRDVASAIIKKENTARSSADISEADVNTKAVRAFRKNYPDAQEAAWSKNNGTYFVSFTVDGVRHKMAFNNNGETEYSLKLFTAEQVPASIVKTMKLSFYDYDVKGAQELTIGNRKVEIVQLAGYKSWKTIRIADGEVEEIQNLRE